MIRNVLAPLLALIGAAAAVWSPFRAWYDGRHGSDIRVDDLFTGVGVTPDRAALLGSLFLPMGFAALLTLLGVLLRSRIALALAGLLVLGITILWMVRQGQAAGSLTAGGNGLDYGVAAAFAGGILILLAAFLIPGRNPHSRLSAPPTYEDPAPPPTHEDPAPPPLPPYEPDKTSPSGD
jgi:4-hydroxybenzoate polyprenyltransferase